MSFVYQSFIISVYKYSDIVVEITNCLNKNEYRRNLSIYEIKNFGFDSIDKFYDVLCWFFKELCENKTNTPSDVYTHYGMLKVNVDMKLHSKYYKFNFVLDKVIKVDELNDQVTKLNNEVDELKNLLKNTEVSIYRYRWDRNSSVGNQAHHYLPIFDFSVSIPLICPLLTIRRGHDLLSGYSIKNNANPLFDKDKDFKTQKTVVIGEYMFEDVFKKVKVNKLCMDGNFVIVNELFDDDVFDVSVLPTSLTHLYIVNNKKITTLGSLEDLKNLEHIEFINCPNVAKDKLAKQTKAKIVFTNNKNNFVLNNMYS